MAQGGSELALLDDEPPLPVLPPELLEPPLDVVSPPLAPAEALLLDPPSLLEAALDELPAELEPPLLEARLELPELPPLEDDPPAWLLDPPLPAPLELELEDDEPPEDDSPELLEPGHPPRRAQQRIKARQAWVRMGTSKV